VNKGGYQRYFSHRANPHGCERLELSTLLFPPGRRYFSHPGYDAISKKDFDRKSFLCLSAVLQDR